MKTVLHFVRRGPADRPFLVLLHGFMGSALSWQPLMDRLAASFQVIAFDLPGHGRSRFDGFPAGHCPGTIRDVAGLLLDDLAALGVGRFFLYGYSMGGRVAQFMALCAPSRIEKLVLESAGFGIADPEERQNRRQKDQILFSNVHTPEDFDRFLETWHRLPLFAPLAGTRLLAELTRAKRSNDPRELARALDVMGAGSQPCVLPQLAGSRIPVLFLYGARDAKYAAMARQAKNIIPGLHLAEFPDASHNIHAQFPGGVADAVLAFLRCD